MSARGLSGALDAWRAWLLLYGDDAALDALWDAPDRSYHIKQIPTFRSAQVYALYELLRAASKRGELIKSGRGLYVLPHTACAAPPPRLKKSVSKVGLAILRRLRELPEGHQRSWIDRYRGCLLAYADDGTLLTLWDAPDLDARVRAWLGELAKRRLQATDNGLRWAARRGYLTWSKEARAYTLPGVAPSLPPLLGKVKLMRILARARKLAEEHEEIALALDASRVWLLAHADDETLLALWNAPDRAERIRALPGFAPEALYANYMLLFRAHRRGQLAKIARGLYAPADVPQPPAHTKKVHQLKVHHLLARLRALPEAERRAGITPQRACLLLNDGREMLDDEARMRVLLHRAHKAGLLTRIARGVYALPEDAGTTQPDDDLWDEMKRAMERLRAKRTLITPSHLALAVMVERGEIVDRDEHWTLPPSLLKPIVSAIPLRISAGARTGRNGRPRQRSAARGRQHMAVILFGTQQAQQQKGQTEASYEEFVEKATGMLSLRGQHLVAENGIQIKARSFLEGVLNDEHLTLTPCTRYRSQDEGDFVSPLTRARSTGWAFNNAFISVNTMVGLLNPGLQLPEYRAVRTCPVGRGQVNDEVMWVTGPWAPRSEFRLYAADADGNIEPLESWITRKLKALQSVN
jgi:hypothetical protein